MLQRKINLHISYYDHIKQSIEIKKETRNYKVFDQNRFNEDLKSKLDSIDKLDYPLFESLLINVLDIHAPVTTKTASK